MAARDHLNHQQFDPETSWRFVPAEPAKTKPLRGESAKKEDLEKQRGYAAEFEAHRPEWDEPTDEAVTPRPGSVTGRGYASVDEALAASRQRRQNRIAVLKAQGKILRGRSR
jgi:hypothetical protein